MKSIDQLPSHVNSLVTKCQHPVRIFNKYTQEWVLTDCGKCYGCMLRKKTKMTAACQNESEKSLYSFFVTLTYADEFVPRLRYLVENCDDDSGNVILSFETVDRNLEIATGKRKRIIQDEILSFTHVLSKEEYSRWKSRVKLIDNQFVPVSNYRDIQLFLKRVRLQLKKYNYELRTYAVSEYGPRTYRPHWHLLFNLTPCQGSETQDLPPMSELVSSCWNYGRSDTSLSRGGASSYVAGYVNSLACLPSLYMVMPRIYRTRQGHSIRFGRSEIFSDKRNSGRIREGKFVELVDGESVSCNGHVVHVRPDRAVTNILFNPLARRLSEHDAAFAFVLFSTRSLIDRLIRLGCLDFRLEYSVMDITRGYYSAYEQGLLGDPAHGDRLFTYDSIVMYFSRMQTLPCLPEHKIINRFYRFFLPLFKTLVYYESNFPEYEDPWELCCFISKVTCSYYDTLDKSLLFHQLKNQEDYPDFVDYYLSYYHTTNSKDIFTSCKEQYDYIVDISYSKVIDSIKHKEFNDMLNLLNS